MATLVPVLLAGGVGKRLWPLSCEDKPKQFLKLAEDQQTLFEATVRRALSVAKPQDVVVVTAQRYLDDVHSQLRRISRQAIQHILLEPSAQNTAAAVTLAAFRALEHCENPILWIMPSDHHISESEALVQAVKNAVVAAEDGQIVTFGTAVDGTNSQYGHIIADAPVGDSALQKVQKFIEKPVGEQLEWALQQPYCYWNSGMFVLSAKTLINEMQKHGPEILSMVRQAYHKGQRKLYGVVADAGYYQQVPSMPIDRVVMENSDQLLVQPLDIGWSDVGSWFSVWQLSQAQGEGDALERFLSTLKQAA